MKLLGGKLCRCLVLLLSIGRDNVQYIGNMDDGLENPSEQLDQKCAKRQKVYTEHVAN